MLDRKEMSRVDYYVMCISEFADFKSITKKEAYLYLNKFLGLKYLDEHYDIEHTLSNDDVVDDLESICRRNGGKL